jgi:hypothetical protein
MDIIKDPATRQIRFVSNGVVVQTLQELVTSTLNEKRNGITLTDFTGRQIQLYTKNIENLQKLPSPPIKFPPGTTEDLWDLLFDPTTSPFFTELHIKFSAGGGGGGLKTKSGLVAGGSFAGFPLSAAVVFAAPFASNQYAVNVTGESLRLWSISGKSAAGFTIESNSIFPITGNVFWECIFEGES